MLRASPPDQSLTYPITHTFSRLDRLIHPVLGLTGILSAKSRFDRFRGLTLTYTSRLHKIPSEPASGLKTGQLAMRVFFFLLLELSISA